MCRDYIICRTSQSVGTRYVRMYICMVYTIRTYIYIYSSKRVSVHVIYIRTYAHVYINYAQLHICTYVYVCMYVCVYIYIRAYVRMYAVSGHKHVRTYTPT